MKPKSMKQNDEKACKSLSYRRFCSTSGFTQAGVYARRKFCADLEVYRPPEPLWNPRLREAATTLCASGGHVQVFSLDFDSVFFDSFAIFSAKFDLAQLDSM